MDSGLTFPSGRGHSINNPSLSSDLLGDQLSGGECPVMLSGEGEGGL